MECVCVCTGSAMWSVCVYVQVVPCSVCVCTGSAVWSVCVCVRVCACVQAYTDIHVRLHVFICMCLIHDESEQDT